MEVLNVSHVSKSIKKSHIIKDVIFTVKQGEIVGFVGPNGAGKTTTIKLITDLLSPDEGAISVCGHDLKKDREAALSNIAAIVETPALYGNLSGKDNVEFFRKIRKVEKSKADAMVEALGMKSRINDKVKKYSLGMKQRLALIICLLSEPKQLILDEPMNGLDPTGTIELRNIIVEQARAHNMAVLVSSHILDELEKICDRIIFIKDGEIVVTSDNHDFVNAQIVKFSFSDAGKAYELTKSCSYIYSAKIEGEKLILHMDKNRLSDLLVLFTSSGLRFGDLEILNSLESEYIDLFGGN